MVDAALAPPGRRYRPAAHACWRGVDWSPNLGTRRLEHRSCAPSWSSPSPAAARPWRSTSRTATPRPRRTTACCCCPRSLVEPRWANYPPRPTRPLYARGQELFDRLGDDFGSGVIRITDAMLAIADGDLARADARVEAVSPFVDRLGGERFSTSRLEYVRGMLEALAGAPRAAYGHIEHSLRLANELGIHHAVTAQARLLVHLAERSGEDGLAAQWRSFVEGRGAGWTHYDASVMASAYTRVGACPCPPPARPAGRRGPPRRPRLVPRPVGCPKALPSPSPASGSSPSTAANEASATRHHRAAVDAAVESRDDVCVALALEGVAVLATRAGDSARAAQPPGAARTSRADTVESTASHRDDIDDVEERLQNELGPEHLARLMELGARLERRAVLAMARSG